VQIQATKKPRPADKICDGQRSKREKLLLQIIIVLVDKCNEVKVTSVTADAGTIFQVTVAPSDVGKVIGKGGRMAGALRILLSAIGVAAKTRHGLTIVTTDDSPLRLR
jgi:predicted RNA-binding protein YlqC (UPF0109 family)